MKINICSLPNEHSLYISGLKQSKIVKQPDAHDRAWRELDENDKTKNHTTCKTMR